MNRAALASAAGRWLRLLPALVLYDPIFRYAAIAFAVALLLLVGRTAQEWAGPGPIPSSGNSPSVTQQAVPSAQAPESSSLPGAPSRPPLGAPAPVIVPGRPLDGLKVEPAPQDTFGRLPSGQRQP